MPGKDIQLPKIVTCEYCALEVHRGDEMWKNPVPQLLAYRALNTHLAICNKASEKVKALVRKSRGEGKTHISNSNCVCCGKVSRADKIVPHILAKHSEHMLVSAMAKDERMEALKHRIPVVKCYKDGSLLFRACLHCKKGALATSVAKVKGDDTILGIKRKEKHTECIAHFEDYKALFEIEDPQTDLPFHLYNCNDPENIVKRNYITLDDEEPEPKRYYIPVKERREMAEQAKEMDPKPLNEVVFEKEEEIEVLKKRNAFLERQMEALEKEAKEGKDRPVLTVTPEQADFIKLWRKMIRDTHEEYSLEELLEEAEASIDRYQNLEEELSKEHRKTLAKLHRRIDTLTETISEKDKIIDTFGTVSFGRGGKAVSKDDTDSD